MDSGQQQRVGHFVPSAFFPAPPAIPPVDQGRNIVAGMPDRANEQARDGWRVSRVKQIVGRHGAKRLRLARCWRGEWLGPFGIAGNAPDAVADAPPGGGLLVAPAGRLVGANWRGHAVTAPPCCLP